MPVYISLLRAINVSGKNTIKMSMLKSLYEEIGFTAVTTYIQSGNVVFKSQLSDAEFICSQIKAGILAAFGLDITVIVLTESQLAEVIKQNPFQNVADEKQVYITYFEKAVQAVSMAEITSKATTGEQIEFTSENAYLYAANGYGKTKLTNVFLERKLGVLATTRNWNTTRKLYEMTQLIK